MKPSTLIAFLLLMLPSAIFAQADFRLGVKGGMNISTFNSKDITNDYVTAGYHFGAYARLPLTGNLSIQPEAQYSLKGTTMNQAIGNYMAKADLRLEYIDAIGLLDLQFAKVMHLQGGLVIGILTDAGIQNKSDNPENMNMEEALKEDDIHVFDPGYAVGLELNLVRLNVGARYTHGLRNISGDIDYKGETLSFPELRNTIYQVYIGLRII